MINFKTNFILIFSFIEFYLCTDGVRRIQIHTYLHIYKLFFQFNKMSNPNKKVTIVCISIRMIFENFNAKRKTEILILLCTYTSSWNNIKVYPSLILYFNNFHLGLSVLWHRFYFYLCNLFIMIWNFSESSFFIKMRSINIFIIKKNQRATDFNKTFVIYQLDRFCVKFLI